MSIFVGVDQINDVNLGAVGPLGQVYLGVLPLLESGSPISPEAQAVLDQMVNLSPQEESAIINLVDGLVKDGLWDFVIECYAPCLNLADWPTDWKNVGAPVVPVGNTDHVPGEGVDMVSFGDHCAMTVNLSALQTANPSGAGAYIVFTDADAANNTDYFGAVNAGLECYLRWRGANLDLNVAWSHTGINPRPSPSPGTRPSQDQGDIIQCGSGAGGTTAYFFNGPDQLSTEARTFEGGWPAIAMHWNGRNNAGASQQARAARHSFWFLLQGHDPDTDCPQMRSRVIQFLTEIGVTGLPTP